MRLRFYAHCRPGLMFATKGALIFKHTENRNHAQRKVLIKTFIKRGVVCDDLIASFVELITGTIQLNLRLF